MGGWLGAFSNNFGTSRFKFIVQMHTSENFPSKISWIYRIKIVSQSLSVLNFLKIISKGSEYSVNFLLK